MSSGTVLSRVPYPRWLAASVAISLVFFALSNETANLLAVVQVAGFAVLVYMIAPFLYEAVVQHE